MTILLIDSESDRVAQCRQALHDLPMVEMLEVREAYYANPPKGLDAIFMTLPAAERWNPDFKSANMQILKTSLEDQSMGFPSLIVTGVNLPKGTVLDPSTQVKLILELSFAAVQAYNARNKMQVKKLGFWMLDLTRGITTNQLIELLHRVFGETSSA